MNTVLFHVNFNNNNLLHCAFCKEQCFLSTPLFMLMYLKNMDLFFIIKFKYTYMTNINLIMKLKNLNFCKQRIEIAQIRSSEKKKFKM